MQAPESVLLWQRCQSALAAAPAAATGTTLEDSLDDILARLLVAHLAYAAGDYALAEAQHGAACRIALQHGLHRLDEVGRPALSDALAELGRRTWWEVGGCSSAEMPSHADDHLPLDSSLPPTS